MPKIRHFLLTISVFAICFCAAALPSLAQGATGIAVTGRVSDENDAPIAGADVRLRGPSTRQTASDASGAFALSGVAPGIYVLSVYKAGYGAVVQNDVTILGGQTTTLAVRMQRQTFSSLRTIASVRTNGRGINVTPASVDVVTTQTFVNQAQPQVTRVLSQIPGLQISFPSNSANAAAPGAITIPNIRSATSFETASLIDGHPISVGQYGDNVTTFLNSFMFGSVEVVKGPGADAPEVNNAIGGTLNFRTKDPTVDPRPEFLAGFDNRGGTFTNFGYSDTVGRLGFVFDFATDNNPSALNGKQVYFDPSGGAIPAGTIYGSTNSTSVGNTASRLTTQFPLLACCYTLYGNLDQTAELAKLRYRLSPATTITLSYLGNQTVSDQNGNTSALTQANFTPDPGYTGALPAGPLLVSNVYPGAFSGEFNNEPIFQGELSSTLGKGSLLARYYKATISRYQYQGSGSNIPDFNALKLYGTSSDPYSNGNYVGTFNGTPANVGFNDFYQEPELDRLAGGSFEYQVPVLENDLVSFSAEQTSAQSTDYVAGNGYFSINLPPGTKQLFSTYRLRGHFFLGRKLELTASDYMNSYSSTYAVNCPKAFGFCTDDAARFGTGVTFATTKNTHNDPRVGLVYRATPSTALRFSAGSSIAPPFLGILGQIASPPMYNGAVAIQSLSNGNLKPETGFGYDLGADSRLRDSTIISGDVYLTNLFNRFFGQNYFTGTTCAASQCPDGNGGFAPPGTPIITQVNTNISNARFEGVELSIRREPAVGFGYNLSGALEKGYYYNLPPYFYCSVPGPGCTPDQNLNILNGQNTNGIPVGFYNVSYNGNMRIPYSQGNGELSYTFSNKTYVSLGATYYGNNNSLNEPAFYIGYATLRYPLSKSLALQLSGDNIFNKYPGYLPIQGAGVPIPLYGGQSGATTGNVLGPATWRLVLSTRMP